MYTNVFIHIYKAIFILDSAKVAFHDSELNIILIYLTVTCSDVYSAPFMPSF